MSIILGIAAAVLCGWSLLQAFSTDGDRAALFRGGVGRFYNFVAILVSALGTWWLLIRPFTLRMR